MILNAQFIEMQFMAEHFLFFNDAITLF